jgi:hypothetical protein
VFRALQESVSSQGSKWSNFEGKEKSEMSGSWARRWEALEVVGEGEEESADVSGLLEEGRDPPKSLGALKQAQQEEMMVEWGELWQKSTEGRSLVILSA